MRFIYLDPPYPGQARKHYKMPEVDHAALIQEAITDYDGFALSTSSSALKDILSGAKPESFCEWIIALLGLELDDTLEDRFPGTGIMGQTWETWRARALGEGMV